MRLCQVDALPELPAVAAEPYRLLLTGKWRGRRRLAGARLPPTSAPRPSPTGTTRRAWRRGAAGRARRRPGGPARAPPAGSGGTPRGLSWTASGHPAGLPTLHGSCCGAGRHKSNAAIAATCRSPLSSAPKALTCALARREGFEPPNRQIRSLEAAGNLASSWKGSAAQESRPLRSAQVAQGRTLTASLTEQSKRRGLRAPDFNLVL